MPTSQTKNPAARNGHASGRLPTASGGALFDQVHAAIADLGQLASVLDLTVRGLEAGTPGDQSWDAAQTMRLVSDRLSGVCECLQKVRDAVDDQAGAA